MQTYFPFLAENTRNLGNSLLNTQNQVLMQSAYLGDQEAQQILAATNPRGLQEIQQLKANQEQAQLSRRNDQQSQEDRRRQIINDNIDTVRAVASEVAAQPDYASAKALYDQRAAQYGDVIDIGEFGDFTEDDYNLLRSQLAPSEREVLGLEKLRLDIEKARADLENSGESTKEILEIQNLISKIEERRSKSQDRERRAAESQRKTQESIGIENAEAIDAIATFDRLISEGEKGLDAAFGTGERFFPDAIRGQKSINLRREIDKMASLLELAAANKLKGQGTVTENERNILRQSITLLKDETISPAKALEELKKGRKFFADRLQSRGENVPESPDGKKTVNIGRFGVTEE